MKVEVQVLDDHIDLLNRIRALPKMIEDHIGKLPQAFPGTGYEIDEIQQAVANLQFKCKKMIFDTSIMKDQLKEVLDNVHLDSNSYKDGCGD